MELPLVPLKQVVLEYLRSGCEASGVGPPFLNTLDSLPWQFLLEDEFEEAESPTWIVSQSGACVPLTDTIHTGWWECPIEVRLVAPISATADWVQDVESCLNNLFNGVYHLRETGNEGEYSPLAIRLTDVAAGMVPALPLYCRSSNIAVLQRIGLLGERIQVTCDVSILCFMQSD
jgi:hypothetical protein